MRDKANGTAIKIIHYINLFDRKSIQAEKCLKNVRYTTSLTRSLRVLVRQHGTITIREKREINRSVA